jgi:hypothetical protein
LQMIWIGGPKLSKRNELNRNPHIEFVAA